MKSVQLKGVGALETTMTKLLKGFGISSVELATEYAYYHISESITFQITHSLVDSWFDDFVTKSFHIEDYDSFVFSLLHEVGHHMTMDSIPEEIQDKVDKKKDWIEKVINFKHMPRFIVRKLEYTYFNLYDEVKATKWAVWYYRNHKDEVSKLIRKANFALMQFYKVNGVTEQ